MKKFAALIVLLVISGCVGTNPIGGGMRFTIQPDPPQAFSGANVRINVDLENDNPRSIRDVHFDIFDSGRLYFANQPQFAQCAGDLEEMKPDELKSFFCYMQAPSIDEPSIRTEVSARASYKTELSAVQVIEMMSEDEYTRRQANAQVMSKPQSYSYRDKNVEIQVEFSDPLPVVVRNNQQNCFYEDPNACKDYFMYITVKNIGNGFIQPLNQDNFKINPVGKSPEVILCPSLQGNWRLDPNGKEFPRIACSMHLPQGVSVVENYGLVIDVNYEYETRTSTNVEIIK